MYQWNESIQKMIDWIEEHITDNPTLLEMSGQIGYSPYYCSTQFHEITGITLKNYRASRRLSRAALEIRDSSDRIIDIAVKYGYSSQEALTRAFKDRFGCTPYQYRKNPVPIILPIKRTVLFPGHFPQNKEVTMSDTCFTKANVRIEFIPAHKYIGIWDDRVSDYMNFWKKHDCEETCGIIDSMTNVMHPVITAHTAGWQNKNGKRGYFYGLGVAEDYTGPVPNGFEIREIPESYYLVFFHPPFDYLRDCGAVMERVEELAWNYDPSLKGYKWNEELCPAYQRHYPEVIGYEVLRPVKKV